MELKSIEFKHCDLLDPSVFISTEEPFFNIEIFVIGLALCTLKA